MYFCLQVDGPINGGGGGGGAYNGKFTVCERGTSCQYKVYERSLEAPCLSKMVYERVRGWTLVGAFPYKTLVRTSLVMGHSSNQLLLASFSCLIPCGLIVTSFLHRTSVNNNIYY